MRQASMIRVWGGAVTPISTRLCCVFWGCYVFWGSLLLMPPTIVLAAEAAELAYARGIAAYANRQYRDALDHFRRAITLEPDNPDAQFYLGLTRFRMGAYPEAITALETTVQLDPSKRYVHYHLGLAYLLVKREKEALAQFKLAEQFDPDKGATQLYLGTTQYQLKQYREALPSLQRALELDLALTPLVRYYQGLTRFALEQDDAAQEAFQAMLKAAPESPLRSTAQRYLDAIAERARERQLLQLRANLSYQYDDNVILEPNDDVFEVSSGADGRLVFTLLGRLQPVTTPSWRLRAEYALYQSKHFSLDDFDVQRHTGRLTARYRLGRVALHGAADYTYTLLDTDRFSEAVTLQTSATIPHTTALSTVVSVRYRWSNFFEILPTDAEPNVRDNDGWTLRAGFDEYLIFNRRRSSVRLGYHYEGSWNDGSDWEFDAHQIGLGVSTSLWGGIFLHADVTYTRRDYRNVNSSDAVPIGVRDAADQNEREDDRITGSLLLTRPLGRNLALSVGVEHIRHDSNISFFEYRRNIWTLTLTGRY